MALPMITGTGTLVGEVEKRYTKNGQPVANFRLAFNSRRFNKTTQEWEDGDATFLPCTLWGQSGENLANSVGKGDMVTIMGRLGQREYETQEGEKRTVYEVTVEEAGPSVKFATARPEKTGRVQSAPRTEGDVWNSAPQGGFAPQNGEPPF